MQGAPIRRIRARQSIDRMGARLTAQTSRRKLALIAYQHSPAVRAERNRRIPHIPDGRRAPKSCAHATLGTGRPPPAYSRRLASQQTVELFVLCAWDVSAPRGCCCCCETWNSAALVACLCRTICTSCDPIEITADTDVTGRHGPAHDDCSAAGSRSAASARSVSIGSIMRAPSYAIDHQRSKPSP